MKYGDRVLNVQRANSQTNAQSGVARNPIKAFTPNLEFIVENNILYKYIPSNDNYTFSNQLFGNDNYEVHSSGQRVVVIGYETHTFQNRNYLNQTITIFH